MMQSLSLRPFNAYQIDVIVATSRHKPDAIEFHAITGRARCMLSFVGQLTDGRLTVKVADCDNVFRFIDETELNTQTTG